MSRVSKTVGNLISIKRLGSVRSFYGDASNVIRPDEYFIRHALPQDLYCVAKLVAHEHLLPSGPTLAELIALEQMMVAAKSSGFSKLLVAVRNDSPNNGKLFSSEEEVIGTMDILLGVSKHEGSEMFDAIGTHALIGDLVVYKQIRRNGIGSSLLSFTEKEARVSKIAQIFLHLDPSNKGATGFYKKAGYQYLWCWLL